MDGMIVSRAAVQGALADLAKFPGWIDEALKGRPRLSAAFTARVENITQFLTVASEIGDPSLQARDLLNAYVQIRSLSMSRRQKQRMAYEQALRALPPRQNPRLCEHRRRVTPEGQYTKFKCLDCGRVGDVERGTTVGTPQMVKEALA